MNKLHTINAEDLQNRTYEPTPFWSMNSFQRACTSSRVHRKSASLGWLCGFAYAFRKGSRSGILQRRKAKFCISASKIRSSVSRRGSLT